MRCRLVLIVAAVLAVCSAASCRDTPGGTVAVGEWGTLWTCGSTYKVMPDATPPSARLNAIRISAAGNEFEPFQIVLRPERDITGVKVTPRSLVGPRGFRIPAWNVTVRNVEYVNITGETSNNAPVGLYPDPLPEHTAFTAPGGRNTAVWVTAYVPPGTPAGAYTSTIDIEAPVLGKVVIPVRLHVWGFDLPSVSKLRTAYGLSMRRVWEFQGAKDIEQQRKLVDLYNIQFWRHRVSPYKPYFSYEIKHVENGKAHQLDFSEFDKAIAKYLPLFNSFQLPSFARAFRSGGRDPEEDQEKAEYMRAVTEHLANKRQIDKGYAYIFDEPDPVHYDAIVEAAELCRASDGRIKTLLTEQVEQALVGSVDIWVPLISMYDEQKSKARQAAGEEVWWYVCCGSRTPYPNYYIEGPAVDLRVLPWITWRYGVDGILYWETAYWERNPWQHPRGYVPKQGPGRGNGGGVLLYPPVRQPSDTFVAKGPVPSIRWELMREGMEDYDYFAILRALIEKASRSASDTPALRRATEALALVNTCAQSRTEYATDPRQLESVRHKVAEAIEALQAAE